MTYVTLNIGAGGIKLLSIKGGEVQTWKSMPLAPGIVKDGLVTQPKVVGAVINALFESAEVTRERVIVSLTGLPFTYRIISLPRMKPTAQREAIQRAARKEIQLPLEDLHLCWQAVDNGRNDQDVFVLGVPRKVMDATVQTLKEAGIKPYIMDINPLALARAAHRGNAIIIDLEPECFDIVIVAGGIPSVMHTVVPRGEGAFAEDNIWRLTDELAKTVEFHNASYHKSPVRPTTPLLMTGELSTDTGTKELIRAATGYPVESLVPPFRLPDDLPAARLISNIGLALKKTPLKAVAKGSLYVFRDLNINLFSGEYGDRDSRPSVIGTLLVVALLIGCILLYPAYQLRTQAATGATGARAELTSVQRELDKRLLATKEARQIQNTIDEVTARAEETEKDRPEVLNEAGEFTSDLRLVSDVLPDTAYFTSIEVGSSQITMEGETDSAFTVIDYVVALENTKKFSDVHIVWIDEIKSSGGGTTVAQAPGVSFSIFIGK